MMGAVSWLAFRGRKWICKPGKCTYMACKLASALVSPVTGAASCVTLQRRTRIVSPLARTISPLALTKLILLLTTPYVLANTPAPIIVPR